MCESGSDSLEFVDELGRDHSLKLLKRNVIGEFNGYVCSCGRLFVSPGIHLAKLDHGCWYEHSQVEHKARCELEYKRESF